MTAEEEALEALDAYQSGAMEDAEAAAFEDQLFESAAHGNATAADFVDHVSLIGQYLLPRGGFDIGSSRARVDALIAAGLRVQLVEGQAASTTLFPAVDDGVDVVATHVPIDVRGYDSVDVVIHRADGSELKTFRDVGWDPLDGTIYAVCEAPLARMAAAARHIRARLIGTREGQQHLIAAFDTVTAP